jgi:chromodomain-helicase-DNA-binding protein 7
MKEIQAELTKDAIHVSDYMLKMIQSSGKMILLEKLIIKMRSEGNKILIFSQFTMMLDLLEEWIKFLNVKYEKIDGSIKAKERQNAIDRFNDPKKKREVFLLSTKAGGLGINLTSANVVVIFDSDWNPQNDVQATARAHRIGQSQEVQVYRLITTRTYEAEMFERASKKLGLDQAIFMGGAFQHTKDDPLAEEDNLKKLNKNEIETLLKKGIMGLIEDQEGEGAGKQAHQDIEEILENARIAKYSLINGTYTFSKSTFVAKGTDVELNVNDPNFWDIVFQNSESPTKKLVDSYETKYKADGFKCPDAQKQIMVDMCDLVSKLIETKKKMEGYSADDEANLDGVLTRISTNKHFHKHYKDIALQMASEIKKPSRRAKKITIADLEIDSSKRGQKNRNSKLTAGLNPIITDKEDFLNDELYESGSEGLKDDLMSLGEDDVYSDAGGDIGGSIAIKSKGGKFTTDFCSVCQRKKCSYKCMGPCKRSFHETCRQKLEAGWVVKRDFIDATYELEETGLTDLELRKKFKADYECTDCLQGKAYCFKCKECGDINLKELLGMPNAGKVPTIVVKEIETPVDEEEILDGKGGDLVLSSAYNLDDADAQEVVGGAETNGDKMADENLGSDDAEVIGELTATQARIVAHAQNGVTPSIKVGAMMEEADFEEDGVFQDESDGDKDSGIEDELANGTNTLLRCKKCLKFYHKHCVAEKFAKVKDGILIKCENHFCHKCKVFCEKLYQCIHCSISYHDKCLPRVNF